MPANTPPGRYTLQWFWDWRQNDGNVYVTCADVTVSAEGDGSGTPDPGTLIPPTLEVQEIPKMETKATVRGTGMVVVVVASPAEERPSCLWAGPVSVSSHSMF